MVKEFHEKYAHYTSNKPRVAPVNIGALRCQLIEEEARETLLAMRARFKSTPKLDDEIDWTDKDDLVQIADGLADLLYVTFGAALAYGIPIEEVFTEVHRSNMTKPLIKNALGKTIKGEGYEPPDIKSIIEKEVNR